MEYSDKALVFLTRHGMEPERIDLGEATAAFLGEMELGLHGRDSSISMLPTYLSAGGDIPSGSTAAVIDAGGTNFRTALVSFGENGAEISDLHVASMPGTSGEVPWEEFISFTADGIAPLLDRADRVGFCFSYPTEETPERDGVTLRLTKELKLRGFEGRLICADLKAELKRRGISGKSFTLLNDTPAVTLSGAHLVSGYDGVAGLIAGTGLNTCCALPDEKIKKPHGVFRGNMLINLESGNFSGLPQGEFDTALDESSAVPGSYRHEKMTSGAYLGELCRLVLRAAAADGLFSEKGTQTALALSELNSPAADAMASGEGTLFDGDDAVLSSELCRAVFDRSARCVCANLSAILILTDLGSKPERPALICADGSLIRRSRVFRKALDGYMDSFTLDVLGRRAVFYLTDNATIIGTAAAAILN